MTAKTLSAIRKIDKVAEEAGGYVANPSLLKPNPYGERRFTVTRRYCIENNKSMGNLTAIDKAIIEKMM